MHVSAPLAKPPGYHSGPQIPFQWLPSPPFEILYGTWRQGLGSNFCRSHGHPNSIRCQTWTVYTAFSSGLQRTQERLWTTAHSCHWDRTPLRRKHFCRRRRKPKKLTPLPINIFGVGLLCLHYYTSTQRSSIIILYLDAILIHHIAKVVLKLPAMYRRQGTNRSTPPLSTPPKPDSSPFALSSPTYLEVLQSMWNKLMHIWNGNVVTISLDQLVPSEPEYALNNSFILPTDCLHTLFKDRVQLSRSLLLSMRPQPQPNPVGLKVVSVPRSNRKGTRKNFYECRG